MTFDVEMPERGRSSGQTGDEGLAFSWFHPVFKQHNVSIGTRRNLSGCCLAQYRLNYASHQLPLTLLAQCKNRTSTK